MTPSVPRLRVLLDGAPDSVTYETELIPGMEFWMGGPEPALWEPRDKRWLLASYCESQWRFRFAKGWKIFARLPSHETELNADALAELSESIPGGYEIALPTSTNIRALLGKCWVSIYVVPGEDADIRGHVILRDGYKNPCDDRTIASSGTSENEGSGGAHNRRPG